MDTDGMWHDVLLIIILGKDEGITLVGRDLPWGIALALAPMHAPAKQQAQARNSGARRHSKRA